MKTSLKWDLSKDMKDTLIDRLTVELNTLRKKAEISQGDLANMIGVSRQTYSAIERKVRKMTWGTYLSLILFFDYNVRTHDLLRSVGAFPDEIIVRFNEGMEIESFSSNILLDDEIRKCIGYLDGQALSSIKTLIMIEYARCSNTSMDVAMKRFEKNIKNE